MIRFSEYMREWLYGNDGYYALAPDIGKDGDFATSVTTSMFFGGAIASRLLSVIDSGFLSKDTCVVEIGAHQGYLTADIVQFIYTLRPKLLKTLQFIIIEPLELLQNLQEKYLARSFGKEIRFRWFKSLKDFKCKEAFVISNELFDAFTCEVVKNSQMLYVSGHELFFKEMDVDVKEHCEKYEIQNGEIAKGYEEFASDLADAACKSEFITFDYGQKHPRGDISLRLYNAHKTYPFFSLTPYAADNKTQNLNLKTVYKKGDLTYDVNFLHLKDAFEKAGFEEKAFCSQSKALIEFGLTDILEVLKNNVTENEYKVELSKAIQLIDPSFLGERFNMMRFTKV